MRTSLTLGRRIPVIVFTLLTLIRFNSVTAQWNSGFGIYNLANGNVGIGVTNPTAKLELPNAGANTLFVGTGGGNRANCRAQIGNSAAVLADNSTSGAVIGAVAYDFYNNGSNPTWSGALLNYFGIGMTGLQSGLPASNQGQLIFQNVNNGVITSNGSNIFMSPNGIVAASFLSNGNVGINTTDTKGYRFAVNGDAVFTKIVVKQYGSWPDYVFDPAYDLPTLTTIHKYIKENHHLPDVPSADSVAANGLDLSANQTILLKKIEELTLYIIEQDKTIKTQNDRLDRLERLLTEKHK